MFHHLLFQNGLTVHLKTQTVKDSRLLLIHKHTLAFFRKLLLWWIEQSNLTLGTTFIPRIFEVKDWADLFENFEDPIDELVKKFYSNARHTSVELKCQVRRKEFTINPDYIAKVLHITRPIDVDLTPYDDKQPQIQDILQVLEPNHEVSSKGTSIGTASLHLN